MKRKFAKFLGVGLALVLVVSFSLVPAAPVSAAALTGVTAAPTDSTAGATTTYTIAFTTVTPLAVLAPADQIIITFPAGFDPSLAAVDAATVTQSGTDPAVTDVTGMVVTLDVAADEPAGVQSIVLSGIVNTQTAGVTYVVSVETEDGAAGNIDGPTNSAAFTINPDVLDHFTAVPDNLVPVVGETVTLTVTAEDQFDNTLTTYSESLFLSQTGADTPALIAWSGADVTDYGDGTGRFTGTWTNAICTVDASYTIAADAVILKVTGDSTGKLASSAAVTWQSVDILTIAGTTYQNGNDTILITFGTEVQPADMGPWDAAVFASVKHDTTSVSLVGASFTPASGLTDTLAITLDEAVAYLVTGETLYVTPAFEAIKGTGGNFVPTDEKTGSISGDSVVPTVALTYSPDRQVKDADTLTITATFSEAMQATPQTPQIAIATQGDGDLSATDMSMGADRTVWTYAWNVASGTDEDGTATVTITGDDLAGNTNATATNNTFDIDNTVPTSTSARPTPKNLANFLFIIIYILLKWISPSIK